MKIVGFDEDIHKKSKMYIHRILPKSAYYLINTFKKALPLNIITESRLMFSVC